MGPFHSTPDLGFSPYPYLPWYPYLLPTPTSSNLPTANSYLPYPATPTSYLPLPPPTYPPPTPTYPYQLPSYPYLLPTLLPLPPTYPYLLPTPPPTYIRPTPPHLFTAFCYFVAYLSLPLPLTTSTFFDHLFSPLFQLSSPDPLTTEALLIT